MQSKTEAQTTTANQTRTLPRSKVVLFNDEDHSYDYVVEMLVAVCGMKRSQAFRCAVEVDLSGRTVVFFGERLQCEQVCSRILAYGPDHRLLRSATSMRAQVEAH